MMASHRHGRATQAEVDGLLQRCSELLPATCTSVPPTLHKSGLHIVLTGSTSTIGLHFVLSWLRSPLVRKLTCLDRKSGAAVRLAPILALLEPHQRAKARFLQAQVAQSCLGLGPADLQKLDDADVFVHNAWVVNYALPLSAFEEQLVGLAKNLCAWAVTSPSRPRIVFTSSYMCVDNYQAITNGRQIPEEIVNDARACHGDGYSASKLIAEQLLGEAQRRCGIPVTILRLGQISGAIDIPANASQESIARFFTWSRREWLYMYLASSQNLGLIAGEGRLVDWIPVDSLSTIMLELISHDVAARVDKPLAVYNLANTPVRWSELVSTIAEHIFSSKRPGKIVSHEEWVAPLRRLDRANRGQLSSYPILRILPLIELLAANNAYREEASDSERFEKKQLLKASPTAEMLRPINPDWMRHYLIMWGFAGDRQSRPPDIFAKSNM